MFCQLGTRLALCVLLTAGLVEPGRGATAWVAYEGGGDDTYLAAFDPTTGLRTGPGAYLDVGTAIDLSEFGGLSFAPDGTAWIAYEGGGSDTYLAAFNPLTGQRTGPGAYLDVGTSIDLSEFGGVSFAPDGTAWVAYEGGGGRTYVAAFDLTTGQRTGPGAYLDVGTAINLTEFGGLAFAPDGTAWIAYAGGGDNTYLAAFDLTTGVRTGPGAYLDVGTAIDLAKFGGLSFAPDGVAWIAYEGGGSNTYLAAFDPTTGLRTGPGAYLNVGAAIDLAEFGGVAFAPGTTVPEPASWAMLTLGFAMTGRKLRARDRRRLGVSEVAR